MLSAGLAPGAVDRQDTILLLLQKKEITQKGNEEQKIGRMRTVEGRETRTVLGRTSPGKDRGKQLS